MSKAHNYYILHDGLLMGQAINGHTLSDEAKQDLVDKLPGTPVGKNLVHAGPGYHVDDVLGAVLLVEGNLVARLTDPLDERAAALFRPAMSFTCETEDISGSQIVTRIFDVLAVALVAKEEGDLGYLEPYQGKLVETAVGEDADAITAPN